MEDVQGGGDVGEREKDETCFDGTCSMGTIILAVNAFHRRAAECIGMHRNARDFCGAACATCGMQGVEVKGVMEVFVWCVYINKRRRKLVIR